MINTILMEIYMVIYRWPFRNSLCNKENEDINLLKCIENGRSLLWDSNKITPGTLFMKKIRKVNLKVVLNVFLYQVQIFLVRHKMMYILENLEIPLKS
jgi:hypothetical protein